MLGILRLTADYVTENLGSYYPLSWLSVGICPISYLISLRLQDAIWGEFSAQNTKTHLHQTMATKMGTNREALCVYTQPEGIGYLVGTVSCGRSNFVNFWTKIWPAEQLKTTNDTPDGQFLMYSRARQSDFLQALFSYREITPCPVKQCIPHDFSSL